ncbi:hypothetical protein NDU88_002739 [Pleurodeles waltl]|uniref:Uncharacterized protein n=1 Tax=Pleurodeles waltl TaxID=8319 RepID=A0AAV7VDF6_PLEWA|nr:hypothetical protein NDU88_002739 [Pleurodeles waltl]
MAPKTACGSQSKPRMLEHRPSQPPPRGVAPRSGSTGNTGRQAALKAQEALEDKQPAPESSPVQEQSFKSKLDVNSSETYDSSTAPLTPTATLRRTVIKCHEGRVEVANPDKLIEPNEKREKKRKLHVGREQCHGTTQALNNYSIVWMISVGSVGSDIDVASVGAPLPSLHLIYQTIMAQHKQTQGDSKKARVTTKQLQVAVSKIEKTCSEIGERIVTIESQANALETELGALAQQGAMHDTQLTDIQRKIEDFENRQTL